MTPRHATGAKTLDSSRLKCWSTTFWASTAVPTVVVNTRQLTRPLGQQRMLEHLLDVYMRRLVKVGTRLGRGTDVTPRRGPARVPGREPVPDSRRGMKLPPRELLWALGKEPDER
jgi:hypothetical protein